MKNKSLRSFSAIAMVGILVINGTGFYGYYFLRLQNIRMEMRAKLKLIPDEELETFTLTLREYAKAVVEENEVRVNGKMYDVARVKVSGNSIRIYCMHDEKEDNLLAFAAEIFGAPMKEKPSVPAQIFQFIGLNFILPPEGFRFKTYATPISAATLYSFSLTEVWILPPAPPPRA